MSHLSWAAFGQVVWQTAEHLNIEHCQARQERKHIFYTVPLLLESILQMSKAPLCFVGTWKAVCCSPSVIMKKIAPKLLDMAGATVSCKWRCMWKIPIIPVYYTNGPWQCSGLQLCIASLFITAHSLEMASLASPKHSLSFKVVKAVLRWRKGHCLEYYFHSWLLGKSQINWFTPFLGELLEL